MYITLYIHMGVYIHTLARDLTSANLFKYNIVIHSLNC